MALSACPGSSDDEPAPQDNGASQDIAQEDVAAPLEDTSVDASLPLDQGQAVTLPEIKIEPVPEKHQKLSKVFSKYVSVFGVNIFATSDTADAKVLHAAHVLAQYLDNDENGVVDDPAVVESLLSSNASLLMTRLEDDFEKLDPEAFLFPEYEASQLLFGEETHPEGSSASTGFDATLEEVLHLVTALGYAPAHPKDFGEQPGSTLAKCMDIARGGQFMTIPNPYPAEAWYHYNDYTCDYRCMATEYIYWALTSLLGAQDYPGRAKEIAIEWELPTPELLQSGDPCVYELLTSPKYKLPSVLPDGSYGP